MLFYFMLLGLYIFFGVIISVSFNKQVSKKIQSLLMIIIFGSISAVRAVSVGTDTQLYNNLYNWDYEAGNWYRILGSKYPLYSLYTYLLHFVSDKSQTIVAVTSLIIIVTVAISIYYYSDNVLLSNILYVTLYFFFNSMNISRQFLAIGVLMIATVCLIQKKTCFFWILFIFACLIHSTAFIGIVFFIIHSINWNKKRLTLFGAFMVILLTFYQKIQNAFMVLFPSYLMYGSSSNVTDVETLSSHSNGGTLLLTIFYIGFICIAALCKVRFKDEERRNRFTFLTLVMLVAVIFGILFYKDILMTRVFLYLSIFSIVYIPEVIELLIINIDTTHTRKLCIRFLIVSGVIAVTFIPLYVQLNKNLSDVIPYTTFFTN